MLWSEEKRFVFVAVPKTGSTAISDHILNIDCNVKRNKIRNSKGEIVSVPTHASSRYIRKVMGDDANSYTFVAFLRSPRDAILSKYYFYRVGRPAQAFDKGRFTWRKRRGDGNVGPKLAARIAFARLVPPSAWAALYPFRHSVEYVVNSEGELDVDVIGRFEYLCEDFATIFRKLGYAEEQLRVPVENRTEYPRDVQINRVFEGIINWKIKADLELYKRALPEEREL